MIKWKHVAITNLVIHIETHGVGCKAFIHITAWGKYHVVIITYKVNC